MAASRRSKGGLAAIVGLVAAAALYTHTPKEEGRVFTTYKDIANVMTYCDGATENAIWGKTYTKAECDEQLDYDLTRHALGIKTCLGSTWARLTTGQIIAFVDMAYNVGITGFCGSTMAVKAKAGDFIGSCTAMFAWSGINKYIKQADGTTRKVFVPIKGLVLRRMRAIEICLTRK